MVAVVVAVAAMMMVAVVVDVAAMMMALPILIFPDRERDTREKVKIF